MSLLVSNSIHLLGKRDPFVFLRFFLFFWFVEWRLDASHSVFEGLYRLFDLNTGRRVNVIWIYRNVYYFSRHRHIAHEIVITWRGKQMREFAYSDHILSPKNTHQIMNEEALSMATAAAMDVYFILIFQLPFVAALCALLIQNKLFARHTNSIQRMNNTSPNRHTAHTHTHDNAL